MKQKKIREIFKNPRISLQKDTFKIKIIIGHRLTGIVGIINTIAMIIVIIFCSWLLIANPEIESMSFAIEISISSAFSLILILLVTWPHIIFGQRIKKYLNQGYVPATKNDALTLIKVLRKYKLANYINDEWIVEE